MVIKKIIVILFSLFIFTPVFVFAQTDTGADADIDNVSASATETFEARVARIVEEKQIERPDGSRGIQQNIKLTGLSGSWKNKEIEYIGITDIDVVSQNKYKAGDRVVVNTNKDIDGNDQFYIMDYVRRGYLFWLALIFTVLIIAVGRGKGSRSLLSLALSFVVIVKYIVPSIATGHSPLITALIGAFIIMALIIYLTDGFKRKTHVAILSVAISLTITFLLSWVFVYFTRLTGFASEEATFLVGIGSGLVDFRGLLLAGILIGALGVLDDAILGQVEAVEQIKAVNPDLPRKEVARAAAKVGRTHLGAIVNTLFLTYAGASLPLLILFTLSQDIGLTWAQAINNEAIATEIVRTLAGSAGIALAFPITTALASRFIPAPDDSPEHLNT